MSERLLRLVYTPVMNEAGTVRLGWRVESDQSRYASECDLCETDGHLHMWDCPNNPLRNPAS